MVILPKTERILALLGENIKLARLRRRLSTIQVIERTGISRSTLYAVEKVQPGVSLGIYAQVQHVLGLEKDLAEVAKDDVLGQKLQDAGLVVKQRALKKKKSNN